MSRDLPPPEPPYRWPWPRTFRRSIVFVVILAFGYVGWRDGDLTRLKWWDLYIFGVFIPYLLYLMAGWSQDQVEQANWLEGKSTGPFADILYIIGCGALAAIGILVGGAFAGMWELYNPISAPFFDVLDAVVGG